MIKDSKTTKAKRIPFPPCRKVCIYFEQHFPVSQRHNPDAMLNPRCEICLSLAPRDSFLKVLLMPYFRLPTLLAVFAYERGIGLESFRSGFFCGQKPVVFDNWEIASNFMCELVRDRTRALVEIKKGAKPKSNKGKLLYFKKPNNNSKSN